jgi:hypothetical protein
MTVGFAVASVAALLASLFLALRALRGHSVSFENKAWMAVAWALAIITLAFALGRLE